MDIPDEIETVGCNPPPLPRSFALLKGIGDMRWEYRCDCSGFIFVATLDQQARIERTLLKKY
jgi:hypothetical protein